MACNGEIRDYVDEYASLTLDAEGIKKRLEWLKGRFEQEALAELRDTKLQTAEFWGTSNNRVTVTTSATVKPLTLQALKKVLGAVAGDFIQEKHTEELTEPCKKFLVSVVLGNYLEGATLAETVAAITPDAKARAALLKKLKGRYDKDKATLMAVAGLDEHEAGDAAYLVTEVMNGERLERILQAAKWEGGTQEAISQIKSAVIVEEGIKVTVAAEPPSA